MIAIVGANEKGPDVLAKYSLLQMLQDFKRNYHYQFIEIIINLLKYE